MTVAPSNHTDKPVTARPAYHEEWYHVPRHKWPVSFATRLLGAVSATLSYYLTLLVLQSIDFFLLIPNLILPPFSPHTAVPPAFSPTHPPSFYARPVAWAACVAARWLGRLFAPIWMWEWAHWEGIGSGGEWGGPVKPKIGKGEDSRSPCPAINALANHGILPRDGRHVRPSQLASALCYAYNLSPTLANQLALPFAPLWTGRGWFDLEDLGSAGLIAHDASMMREDIAGQFALDSVVETQSTPSKRLIDLYFPADAPSPFGLEQLSRALAHVRKETFDHNGQNYLDLSIDLLGSGNTALIHKVIGTDMAEIRPWVGSDGFEHFAPGFEPKYRGRMGLPIAVVQWYNLVCELGAGGLPREREVEAKVESVREEVAGKLGGGGVAKEAEGEKAGGEEGYVVDGAY